VNSVAPYWPYPPYYPWGQVVFGFTIPHGSIEGNYSFLVTFQVDTTIAFGFLDGLDLVYMSTENRSGTFEVEALRLLDVLDAVSGLGESILEALSVVENNVLSAIADLSTKLDDLEASTLSAIQGVLSQLEEGFAAVEAGISDVRSDISSALEALSDKIDDASDSVTSSLTSRIDASEAAFLAEVSQVQQLINDTRGDIDAVETLVENRFDTLGAQITNTTQEIESHVSSAVNSAQTTIISALVDTTGALEQVITQNFSDASTFILVLTLLVIITLILVAIATIRVLRLRPPE
ncbi:MAG: hypothetical protein ACE5KH_04770, partial [Candidatus Geothermarchaeales archaeon]